MPNYEQVFDNVFDRRESKYCGVLIKKCHKFEGKQVIFLQTAQQLKVKNINVVPGQLFCISIKLNLSQRQTHCLDHQDKVQAATVADKEFNECQTPRKKL